MVWACDTTAQVLPNNDDTKQIGIHKNQYQETASVKISTYYDVFNTIITLVGLFDKRTSDLLCCIETQIKQVPTNVIAIYDRAYGSHILPFFHGLYGSKYVIRLKTSHSNTVKDFMQSSKNEILITEPMSEKTCKRLATLGIRKSKSDTITYRLVKVILSTSEVEILMTNLDNSFTISDLSELYRLRWGVETSYSSLKSHQMLGTFSGYSAKSVKQDIWCNLIFYNLQSITMLDSEKSLAKLNQRRSSNPSPRKKKENKGYKINRNIGSNTLRMHLRGLFVSSEDEIGKLLTQMQQYYMQSLELVKESRNPRKRKLLRQNGRHHTEMNYKRGF